MDNPYYEKLMNAALRFVSYRPRSTKEFSDFLDKKLAKWNVSGDLLRQKVIVRMGELGYVDDTKFAQWWVSQRTSFRPKGNRVVEAELRSKGVPRSIITTILATRGSASLLVAAKKATEKKMRFWAKLPVLERKQMLYGYLARRGFDSGTITKLIDEEA